MKHFVLIGFPLSHSKSSYLHQIIGKHRGVTLTYVPLSIQSDEIESLLEEVRNGKYQGFNVTIPYKETVIPFLDELTDKAKRIGAVNTIYLKEGKLVGDNTDYDGFQGVVNNARINLKDKRVIVLGSGGAAKAVYQVLLDFGVNPTIVSRKKVIDQHFSDIINYESLRPNDYDVIINSTPVGMYPNDQDTPLAEAFVKDKIVFDLIYNPRITKLMSYAKMAYNGLDMLIIQAIKAQDLWYNQKTEITKDLIESIRGEFDEQLRQLI